MNQSTKQINHLTIDVEDYYQVSAFEDIISPDDWESYESRVENNTQTILKILDSKNIKATFFIVGWIAEKNIDLVKEIAQKGHQIGCHSYLHRKVYDLTPDEFRNDTKKAKTILEKISGTEITGYRAPSYSITKKSLWALYILAELGFKYHSSIFPILLEEKPDILLVVGDVNSTIASTLVASKIEYSSTWHRKRPILVHVEAGLRSFDRDMPEEINRILTDALSDLLFVTERT